MSWSFRPILGILQDPTNKLTMRVEPRVLQGAPKELASFFIFTQTRSYLWVTSSEDAHSAAPSSLSRLLFYQQALSLSRVAQNSDTDVVYGFQFFLSNRSDQKLSLSYPETPFRGKWFRTEWSRTWISPIWDALRDASQRPDLDPLPPTKSSFVPIDVLHGISTPNCFFSLQCQCSIFSILSRGVKVVALLLLFVLSAVLDV